MGQHPSVVYFTRANLPVGQSMLDGVPEEGPPPPSEDASLPKWFAQRRYRVLRRLGSGGFADVFAAWDRRAERQVAIKVLRNTGPESLYRFKNEFRALAGIRHRNLVQLHELCHADGQWLCVMELVSGKTLNDHLRHVTPADALGPITEQLVAGLQALHAAGHLHCDLKPDNIMVQPDGRVVILDFGLLGDRRPASSKRRTVVTGTPAYMSPEQSQGHPPTTASDWYALGVVLFESLTGHLPFSGRAAEVMLAKQRCPAPDLARLRPDLPARWSTVCRDLLERDATKRANGAVTLRTLEARPMAVPLSRRDQPLLGRDAELSRLHLAFADATRGLPSVTFVHGAAGMGKTALVRRFLDDCRGGGEAVLLDSRCNPSENLRFNALDGLIDSLSRALMALPRAEAYDLLDDDIGALATVFPVLRRVGLIRDLLDNELVFVDLDGVEDRAIEALARTVERLSALSTVVLFIDDLQWADEDSARALRRLVRLAAGSHVLVCGTYRPGERGLCAAVQSITAAAGGEVDDIELGPLDADAARALDRHLRETAWSAWSLSGRPMGSNRRALMRHHPPSSSPRVRCVIPILRMPVTEHSPTEPENRIYRRAAAG